ncbi:hypothetical protein HPB50_020007 [Hyalomma asiaticum]|uniref:Uncharacterized protein n=1 Tax=Hyalomma asiaticum TaxID=266040 RepID=A0ACB7RL07_HYAAI|nr:hypothetical protein HPB50_020007 [Hyalomma asiaticum]
MPSHNRVPSRQPGQQGRRSTYRPRPTTHENTKLKACARSKSPGVSLAQSKPQVNQDDFNARHVNWGYRKPNPKGKMLAELVESWSHALTSTSTLGGRRGSSFPRKNCGCLPTLARSEEVITTRKVPPSTGGSGPESKPGHLGRDLEQSRPEPWKAAYLRVHHGQLERPGLARLHAFGSGTRHRSRATSKIFTLACSISFCPRLVFHCPLLLLPRALAAQPFAQTFSSFFGPQFHA